MIKEYVILLLIYITFHYINIFTSPQRCGKDYFKREQENRQI
jgi:hypothetical protein